MARSHPALVVLVSALWAAPGLAAERPPLDDLPPLLQQLASDDQATRELAKKKLVFFDAASLRPLVEAREAAAPGPFRDRLDETLDRLFRRWARTLLDNLRGLRPEHEERCADIASLYAQLPFPEKDRFWRMVETAWSERFGEEFKPGLKPPALLARLGLAPIVEESTLELRADGSGVFRVSFDLKRFTALAKENARLYEEAHQEDGPERKSDGSPADAGAKKDEQLDGEFEKEMAKEFAEFPAARGITVLKDETGCDEAGMARLALRFTSLGALNGSLKTAECLPFLYRPEFTCAPGPEGVWFFQRQRQPPENTGMLGIELLAMDGVCERFVLKAEIPIHDATGLLPDAKESIWIGPAWDFLHKGRVAAELATSEGSTRLKRRREEGAAELPRIRELIRSTDADLNARRLQRAPNPGAPPAPRWKSWDDLASPDLSVRRGAVAGLVEQRGIYDQEQFRYYLHDARREAGPRLLAALAVEKDFRVRLEIHNSLLAWYEDAFPKRNLGAEVSPGDVRAWLELVEKASVTDAAAGMPSPTDPAKGANPAASEP